MAQYVKGDTGSNRSAGRSAILSSSARPLIFQHLTHLELQPATAEEPSTTQYLRKQILQKVMQWLVMRQYDFS